MDTTVIINSVITEKSNDLAEKNTYAFFVKKDATKVDIKNALRQMYGVNVAEVKIVKNPAKKRRSRYGEMIKRKQATKAYITLAGKEKLDISALQKDAKTATNKASTKKASESTAKKSEAKKTKKTTTK